MPTKHERLCLAGIAHERSSIYGNIRTSAKRPEWNQDKSSIEPYQKADYLFSGAHVGVPSVFPHKRGIGDTGAALIMVGAMLPFFFWQCMKRRFPGREDFILHAPAEGTHAGNQTV